IAELYSERTKWPSADNRMPRQKISSDCWPHRTSGLAGAERKKRASGETTAATTTTIAKNETSRIEDNVLLSSGQSSFSRTAGNGSQSPWMIQVSLIAKPSAMTIRAGGKTTCCHRCRQSHLRRSGSPRAAPETNRNCHAKGLKNHT